MADNINTAILDRAVDRAAMNRLYEANMLSKLYEIIKEHTQRTSDLILTKGKNYKEELDKEIKRAFGQLYQTNSKSLVDLAGSQISYTYQTLEANVGKIWTTTRPLRSVAEELVLKRPLYNDLTLLEGWGQLSLGERKRIELLMRKGIAEGLDEKQLALLVRKSNIFNVTRNQSFGLARTAMTSVYAQADHEVYESNKALLRGYEYVAVLDSRTTPICAGRDGKIFPVGDRRHLPPAHWHCRSTTIPVVKKWDDLAELDNISQIRKRNLMGLSEEQKKFYDGQTPLKESYSEWLQRQPQNIQLKHLGDLNKVEAFQQGLLSADKFQENGRSIGIRQLRQMTDPDYGVAGDTRRFTFAKQKLDAIKLGPAQPEDIYDDPQLVKNLREYYLLQAGELDGTLSYTNYRGTLLHTKKATRRRVLTSPPTEEQLRFNPITNRYEDVRLYQPMPAVLSNNLRLVKESDVLKAKDKEFIENFVESLSDKMSINERAVITDNLRITLTRFRKEGKPWGNFKAVINGQMKFDVMNVSDYMETQLRRDSNLFARLEKMEYFDPVLGAQSLQELHDKFIDNIFEMRHWEYNRLPKIARRLRSVLDLHVPLKLRARLDDADLEDFYLKFAKMLAAADTPDRDQLAVMLGRSLYNAANYRGSRNEWYKLGVKLLDDADDKGFYKIETFGVQKRRMKSRIGGRYFGPYYDTLSYNIRIVDEDILHYAKLNRAVDVGLRVPAVDPKKRLYIRPGFKTYFDHNNRDTGIPIVSADSVRYFPVDMIDDNMALALNQAHASQFKVDQDFHDAIEKILFFKDDKGKAAYYDNLNIYKKYIASRGDSYERFKAMKWLREKDYAFSNAPFLDHRGRIYDRGLIGPQSGETFRPFLNTAISRKFSKEEFLNFQDQVGSFLGGLSDSLEGNHSSLTVLGRQKIAQRWRGELIKIGDHLRRGKPNDIRAILENEFLLEIDGEEQGKALRFAIELSKINEYLEGDFSPANLVKLKDYDISLALEQDASSSGAQIIALTTKNKQLAELSNVIPTNQKKRLYDEIASDTFNDPRFRELNKKLGLTEKDLRKASKAQNMVTFYGAGERTGIMNVEGKLAKILEKDSGRLVVKAAERDAILDQISARAARYKDIDTDTYEELMVLRKDVKDIFNKGLAPGDEIMDQLFFLDPKTRDFVEKLTRQYDNVVTPDDFQIIAGIMSENLRERVPILKDFTRFFGRLAEDYVLNAKPSESFLDWKAISKQTILGSRSMGAKLPRRLSEALGINPNEPLTEKVLKRFSWWNPNSTWADLLFGMKQADFRRTGIKKKIFEIEYPVLKGLTTGSGSVTLGEFSFAYPNKLPKDWTQIPWVNFDGKVLEQQFTQVFEEKLRYKAADGTWVTNILQVPQKTDPSWWDELLNKSGKINDIVDAQKARTAYAVNGNHSNDATLVKNFHLWGHRSGVQTATIHDAFFTNAGDLLRAKSALRKLYADAVDKNTIKATLDEMHARGLPDDLYNEYLNEAIDIGLIPVVGRSRINGKLLTEEDILKVSDILEELPPDFTSNRSWYGIGG